MALADLGQRLDEDLGALPGSHVAHEQDQRSALGGVPPAELRPVHPRVERLHVAHHTDERDFVGKHIDVPDEPAAMLGHARHEVGPAEHRAAG